MPDTLSKIAAASRQQIRRRDAIATRLLKALLGLWGGFGSWDDQAIVSSYAAKSAVLVDSALQSVRKNQRSYLSATFDVLGADVKHLPPELDAYPRSGTNSLDVYWRPAKQARYFLSEGADSDKAVAAAIDRLEALANTDVAAADRLEANNVYSQTPQIVGTRRIIHPERSAGGTCGLCMVAATRFYTVDELQPLHDRCQCTTLGITKGNDPGLKLNDEDLDRIYEAAGSKTAAGLKRVQIEINEHGELGPVLREQGEHFRDHRAAGAKPFKKTTAEAEPERWAKMRDNAMQTAREIRNRIASGDAFTTKTIGERTIRVDNEQSLQYNLDLIARMEQKLKAA